MESPEPQFDPDEEPLSEAEIAEGATLDDDERVREAQDREGAGDLAEPGAEA